MKLTLLSLCFLLFSSAFSQHPIIGKLWVGDVSYIQVDSNTVRIEYIQHKYSKKSRWQTDYYKYTLSGDTLRLTQADNGSEKCDFLIELLPNKDLKLIPITWYRWEYFNTNWEFNADDMKKGYTFRDQEHIYTDTIRLERIVFSSAGNYGGIRNMSFQIDCNKQMKFIGSFRAIKEGPHTAALSEEQYNELLKLLVISNLDKLENAEGILHSHITTFAVEVHYNHKIKYFKIGFPPLITRKLLWYLRDLPEKVELKAAAPMEIHFATPGGN